MRVALLPLAAACALAPAASAAAPKSCNAKRPVFRDGPVRIWTAIGRFDTQRWWICSSSIRKPKPFDYQGAGVEDDGWKFRRFGSRIGFSWIWDNGEQAGWEIGWIGTRAGRVRRVDINFDDRIDSRGIEGVAIAPDGSMAFVETVDVSSPGQEARKAQRIGVSRLGSKGLGKPKNVTRVDEDNVDPATLAFDGTTITWMTTDGQPGSATLA